MMLELNFFFRPFFSSHSRQALSTLLVWAGLAFGFMLERFTVFLEKFGQVFESFFLGSTLEPDQAFLVKETE